MSNIRVNVNYTIKDGASIAFRSPVDCSQVTGLVAYYPGEDGNTASKEFAFADAHGNNVGDIDHLFAENVVVKVILDVTAGMAYVQNADTNAYIEKTFVKTVNGIAPDESGNVTVEVGTGGSSVTVDTELDAESTNPVQNKVIAEAISTFTDEVNTALQQQAASIPTDDHINSLISAYIDEALGGEY